MNDPECTFGYQTPLKNTTALFLAKHPVKSANCLSPPVSVNPKNINFSCKNCNPPPLKKVTPLFPTNSPLKLKSYQAPPPFFENLIGDSTHLIRKGWGAHYVTSC